MNQGLGQEHMSLWGCLMQTNLGTPSTAGGGDCFFSMLSSLEHLLQLSTPTANNTESKRWG